MKLINCYVENFGNISKKSIDFDENLTSVCEKNGFGKTTLAAFIKAMFYGLPTSRKSSDFDDRQHYCPFAGGNFGGNLTYEQGGKQYKIYRNFDKKSAAKDESTLYSGGNCIPVPESLGKELFGLDEDSFMRTVFINSNAYSAGVTGGISAKLNNFVDDTDDGNNYDSAMNILQRKQKEYKAGRGSGGEINRCNAEIVSLKEQIRNIQSICGGLGEKYARREQLTRNISAVQEDLDRASSLNGVLEQWNTFERMSSDADSEKANLEELKGRYPAGLPSEEEIGILNERAKERADAESRLESAAFSSEKQARFAELERTFAGGVPSEEELDEAQQKLTKAASLSGSDSVKNFNVLPDDKEVAEYTRKLALLADKKEEAKKLAAVPAANPAPAKKNYRALAILLIAAGLLITGVALMFVNVIAGASVLALGVCCALAGGFFYFKEQIKAVSVPAASNAELTGLQAQTAELENLIRSYLSGYGYFSKNGAEADFNDFLRDMEQFKRAGERNAQRQVLESEVNAMLSAYGAEGDLQRSLNSLRSAADEYLSLNKERQTSLKRAGELNGQIQECNRVIQEIFKKYSVIHSVGLLQTIKTLEADAREYSRLEASVKRLADRAKSYKAEHGLTQKPEGEKLDTAELSARLSALNRQLSILDGQIAEEELSAEKLPDLESALEEKEELLKEFRQKYELLSLTADFLERAEQNLKDKYVAPVKDKFLYYSHALERALGEKVVMDKDFKVYFERNGENRSDRHLSAGQYALCALCLRLALIDNMYVQEKPFIIMDDPFVNLDEEHMQRAAALIKELSADRQLIYFCCHESRLI